MMKKFLLYFSIILSSSANEKGNAHWLSGEWGLRLSMPAGIHLDNDSYKDHYVLGAAQIVTELTTANHVISNLSGSANGGHYSLRRNAYVNIANEIHPDMVPSAANENVILDVIQQLKSSGKRVILYIAADGPGGKLVSEEIVSAWDEYCDTKWDGDEHAAYMNMMRGFFERLAGVVDGYWLDHFVRYPGTASQQEEFIQMIRDIDSNVAITANNAKVYFDDKVVDTDGADETFGIDDYEQDGSVDGRNYKVIKMEPSSDITDFTSGHPTPLAWGAPSNSWAYEENTIPDMVRSPITVFPGGVRPVVKHIWLPLRETWNGSSTDLVFDQSKAYRFVNYITNGEASITWGNTMINGYINEEEMKIFKFINDNLQESVVPEIYVRPEGAFYEGQSLDIEFEASGFDDEIKPLGNLNIKKVGSSVRKIQPGNWVCYNDFNFETGASGINLMAASPYDGNQIEIRLGSPSGNLIGSTTVPSTGSWTDFTDVHANIDSSVTGVHDMYFVFTGNTNYLMNIHSFKVNSPPTDLGIEYLASAYDSESNPNLEDNVKIVAPNGNSYLGQIRNGNWIKFNNFNLEQGVSRISCTAASAKQGGVIEVRLNNRVNGQILGEINIPNTGGWRNFERFSTEDISSITGEHTIYLVFKGGSNALMTLKSFKID